MGLAVILFASCTAQPIADETLDWCSRTFNPMHQVLPFHSHYRTNRWLQKWDYDSTGGDLYMEWTMIKKCRGNAYLGFFCKSKLAATCISGAVGGLLDPFHELDVFPPLKISTIRLLMSAPRDVSLAGFSTPKGKVDRLALSIKKSFNTAIINWFQDSLHIIIMKSDKSYLWLSLPKIKKAAFKAVVFSISDFPYAMATWHPQYI